MQTHLFSCIVDVVCLWPPGLLYRLVAFHPPPSGLPIPLLPNSFSFVYLVQEDLSRCFSVLIEERSAGGMGLDRGSRSSPSVNGRHILRTGHLSVQPLQGHASGYRPSTVVGCQHMLAKEAISGGIFRQRGALGGSIDGRQTSHTLCVMPWPLRFGHLR